jgi:hypothetical protein
MLQQVVEGVTWVDRKKKNSACCIIVSFVELKTPNK